MNTRLYQRIHAEYLHIQEQLTAARRPFRFEYMDASITLYPEAAGFIDWARQHFIPGYLAISDGASADAMIYTTQSPTLFKLLEECFADWKSQTPPEQGYIRLPLDDQTDMIYEQPIGRHAQGYTYCLLSKSQRRLVFLATGDPISQHLLTMRIMRSLFKYLLIERGWIPFHAACCVSGGTGMCITGDKFAGKTSTLINLLTAGDAQFVSNDKLMLRAADGVLLACALPHKIGIRVGTFMAHPMLRHWLVEAADTAYPKPQLADLDRITATTTTADLPSRTEKVFLMPYELAQLFDASVAAVTQPTLVLLPIFTPGIECSELVPVGADEAVAYLATQYLDLSAQGQAYLQSWFALSDKQLRDRLWALLAALVPTLQVFKLYQNEATNRHSIDLIKGLTTVTR